MDIDNTLADTWPEIGKGIGIQYSNLKHFPIIKEIILDYFRNPDVLLLFCTVRPFNKYNVTVSWLRKIGIPVRRYQVVMAGCPEDKLLLLSQLSKPGKEVYIYDDLSYNHEHGEVRLYSHIIDLINKMNIKYIGYSELKQLQLKSPAI